MENPINKKSRELMPAENLMICFMAITLWFAGKIEAIAEESFVNTDELAKT